MFFRLTLDKSTITNLDSKFINDWYKKQIDLLKKYDDVRFKVKKDMFLADIYKDYWTRNKADLKGEFIRDLFNMRDDYYVMQYGYGTGEGYNTLFFVNYNSGDPNVIPIKDIETYDVQNIEKRKNIISTTISNEDHIKYKTTIDRISIHEKYFDNYLDICYNYLKSGGNLMINCFGWDKYLLGFLNVLLHSFETVVFYRLNIITCIGFRDIDRILVDRKNISINKQTLESFFKYIENNIIEETKILRDIIDGNNQDITKIKNSIFCKQRYYLGRIGKTDFSDIIDPYMNNTVHKLIKNSKDYVLYIGNAKHTIRGLTVDTTFNYNKMYKVIILSKNKSTYKLHLYILKAIKHLQNGGYIIIENMLLPEVYVTKKYLDSKDKILRYVDTKYFNIICYRKI